jgi:hypothetical protein
MVYVLFDGEYYKIGVTTSDRYKTRLRNLSTGNARELQLITYLESPFAKDIEKKLQKRFSCNRVRREWFWLDNKGLAELFRIINYFL